MTTDHFNTFMEGLPVERKGPVAALIDALRSKLPEGFAEHSDGRMVHFSVPFFA